MAEVLVLAEHSGGEVKKVTCELLTAARRLGSPSVVWTGPGAEGGQARCAEYGAARMYVAADAAVEEYVVAPAAELLAQLVREKSPALVNAEYDLALYERSDKSEANPHRTDFHAEFAAAMRSRSVDIGRAFPPLDRWARISIGLPEENALAQAALRDVMARR